MKRFLFILISFPLITFSQLTPAVTPHDSILQFYQYRPATPQLTPKAVNTPHGRIGFYEFKPPGYNPDSSYNYPLIIFLHGVGERGNGTNELSMILNSSLSQMIANGASMNFTFRGKPSSFVVLLPQMSKEYINWQNFYTDAMINYARQHLKIDTNKIFLSGWSLGGGGGWKYVTTSQANARRIAGIVIAGPAPDYEHLDYIAKENVAVWAHHAKDDASVPLHLTTDAIEEINAHSPDIRARVSYYRSGGHPFTGNAPFDTLNTYLYPNVYEWMAGTSRKNTLAGNQPPVPLAGHDTAITVPNDFLLNGAGSYDPNDVITQYEWKMVSGPPSPQLAIRRPDRPVTSVSGFELGDYTFRLTVEDEFGAVRSKDVRIHVGLPAGGANANPYARAGADTTVAMDEFALCSYLKDFDGHVVSCRWRQISGPAPVSIAQQGKCALVQGMTAEGVYRIELTAYDNHHPAGIGKDTVTISRIASIPTYILYRSAKKVDPEKKTDAPVQLLLMCLGFLLLPVCLFQWVEKSFWLYKQCGPQQSGVPV